jgi:hypothetical protein
MFGDTYGATRDDVRGPSFAGKDAPLIGEPAATRGPAQRKVAMSTVGVRPGAIRSSCSLANARGWRRDRGRTRSAVQAAASVAGHDAPRIGERAATRWRLTPQLARRTA